MKKRNYVENTEVKGTVVSNPELVYTTKADEYYVIKVATKRKSDTFDVVPVVVARKTIDPSADYVGMRMELVGMLQSRIDEAGHLFLQVFTKKAEILNTYDGCEEDDVNNVTFEGVLKNVIYRKTSSGITIADSYIVYEGNFIPCLAWNNKADEINVLDKNTVLSIKARFQSREYNKEVDGEIEKRVAYEVSMYDFDVVEK